MAVLLLETTWVQTGAEKEWIDLEAKLLAEIHGFESAAEELDFRIQSVRSVDETAVSRRGAHA